MIDPVLDAASDVRKSHQPNEYDQCVADHQIWPCDAEMLAELVVLRLSLTQSGQEPPFFKTQTCGAATCNWSGPVDEFENHPHKSF